VDTRRLRSFVKIVDTGSITRAADLLNIAQPALSQQLAALEAQFRQQLLIRGSQGVTPTEAGRTLYRHAQIILRQFDLAYADVSASRYTISGKVSIGLAPYSGATRLSTTLLRTVREELPGVTLHLVESYGQAFSELVINGRLDMAVIHGAGPIKGARFKPLITERFFLIAPLDSDWPDAPVPLQALAGVPMLLPPTYNFVRRAVELAFLRGGAALNLAAEIESLITLGKSVTEGLGSTIMPMSFARDIVGLDNVMVRDIDPPIEETLSICLPEHSTLSEPAEAVRQILERLEPLMQSTAG
jgi:LysR family nitrogen assimilation transcriptional regulator